jgi:uncharacterized protein DUF4271
MSAFFKWWAIALPGKFQYFCNSMIRYLLLLSLFLFLFSNVFGQTDSIPAPAAKDTNLPRTVTGPRNKEGDSGIHIQDTLSRTPKHPVKKPAPATSQAPTTNTQPTTSSPAATNASPTTKASSPTNTRPNTSVPPTTNASSPTNTPPTTSSPAATNASPTTKASSPTNTPPTTSSPAATNAPAATSPTAITGAAPAAGRDSVDSAGSGLRAMAVTGPITRKDGSAERKEGPTEMTMWKSILAADPFFNFSGTPVVEIEEIHQPNSKDSLFYLLLGILFYFALFRIFFEKYFNNLLTLFFRVSLRQQQIREQVLQTPLPSLLLNLLFIATAGLFASYLLHYSRLGMPFNFWILYLDCMVGIGLIYLAKFLLLKCCGWIFNISRATDIYIFIVFLVNKMVGIFLLPLLIMITFSGPDIRDIFVTISLTMIFVLLGYRVFASYRPIRNEIKLTPFYFFLYLCAFEIAPLLLIYKVLLQYLEKGY